jgi:ADP-ribosylglycohydrolase
MLEDKWDRRDPCPQGALKPFNIDAKLNGAYIALGLLYGDGDFGKTIEIATRSGQDSDCNPASAGGVLGVMLGYDAIPEEYKGGIPAIAEKTFQYTNFTFHSIVDSTEKRTLALVQKTGGRVEGNTVSIQVQAPKAPKLEVWDDYGAPVERIDGGDKRWTWTGEWKTQTRKAPDNSDLLTHRSAVKGATAAISFEGTGAVVAGAYLTTGGMLEVYLDEKLDRKLDVYSDERGDRAGEAVWHVFGLKPGKHTVRLVVLGERYPESGGADVSVDDLIVYR